MPIGDRIRKRRHDEAARRIFDGDEYTVLEDVVLDEPEPADEPPVIVQGEPWGWRKGAPYPRGWREDGKYGSD